MCISWSRNEGAKIDGATYWPWPRSWPISNPASVLELTVYDKANTIWKANPERPIREQAEAEQAPAFGTFVEGNWGNAVTLAG
jgi:hypothetical protein